MEIGPKPTEAGVATPRAVGRIVLAGMLTVLVGLIALPLGLAQTATTIEFVNPTSSSSAIVSDKVFPYGITAWIDAVPANPRVEFRLKTDTGPVTNGGPFVATQTAGSTDTFQFDWTIDDAIADGDYILEATLFKDYTGPGTGTVVDIDEQEVTVDQAAGAPPLGAPAAENVRISYPVNGGPLGVSLPATGGASFLIEGDTGALTDSVAGFYTISPVGTEATFKTCGDPVVPADTDTDGDGDFQIRCEVAAEDFGLDVTGVAASASSPGIDPFGLQPVAGASDGHRVKSYFQRPTTVDIEPATIGNATTSTCQTFAVAVKDQNARPITGANVDVHAQGPNDSLKFDVSAEDPSAFGSSPSKAPDKGDHGAEAGVECAADGSSSTAGAAGTQGSHPVAGESSRKHIESIAGGTDSAGKFTFALYNTATGTTQITAFGDLDDDDLLCNTEAKDAASIGWGTAAPTPAAEAGTVPTCAVSDPTPTPSATTSATASATTSATASPTSSASPTTSPSPSVSPTPEPNVNERKISLKIKDAKRKMLKAKGRVTLKDAGDFEGCTQDVPVTLQKRKKGKWVNVGTDTTNNAGKYAIKAPHKHGRYRALAPEVDKDGGQEICSRAKKARRFKH